MRSSIWDARSSSLRRNLGLYEARADDATLAERLLEHMTEQPADFTLTFHSLAT